MRVLVTWGSERGGTEGIANAVADVLYRRGHDVTQVAAREAPSPDAFDAVIIGGALYANRWHRHARRYANRYARPLRDKPTWLFSSGPLDASADAGTIAPIGQVRDLVARVGARGHVTFGGRLAPDAKGLVARAMAKTHAGDWRNFDRVRAWANQLADGLPAATPGRAVDLPGRSPLRLLAYALESTAVATAAFVALLLVSRLGVAIALAAAFTPLVFGVAANRYFRAPGARGPLPTSAAFAGVAAVPAVIEYGAAALSSVMAFWIPITLVFIVTWAVGAIRSMLPLPKLRSQLQT